jgi:poly(hydroxyalkanoate) depolymerase family esterase
MPDARKTLTIEELVGSKVVTAEGKQVGRVIEVQVTPGPEYRVIGFDVGLTAWLERLHLLGRLVALRGTDIKPRTASWDDVVQYERFTVTLKPGRKLKESTTPVGRGRFVDGSYTSAHGTRAYKLYIPSGYTGQAVPLLVMLHGCFQDPDEFAAGTSVNALAELHTFLAVYPAQASSANVGKCWNWFRREDQQRGAGEPALLAGLTRQIMASYHVDARRVFVAGMSAGAAMSVILGATYPDLYAAVGVHSGLAYAAAHNLATAITAMWHGALAPARPESNASGATGVPTRVVPTIVFHGDRDTTVNVVNADHVLTPWVHATEERETTHRPDQRVRVERGQVPGGYAYTRSIYHDPRRCALMEKWIVHQMGHAWSGGSPSESHTDPKGPNASAEMVRFFSEHPLEWSQPLRVMARRIRTRPLSAWLRVGLAFCVSARRSAAVEREPVGE